MILNQENGGESVAGYSCNHNCEQGKRCPARQACQLADDEPEEKGIAIAVLAGVCGLAGLAVFCAFLMGVVRTVHEHWPLMVVSFQRWIS